MKFFLYSLFLFFILIWLGVTLYLLGYIPLDFIPDNISKLKLPNSTGELGDSLALIDSLFASVALVLGLVAILIQGKELKESTNAQISQAEALILQIKQQKDSNLLGAYSARQNFLLMDSERLEKIIEKQLLIKDVETDPKKKTEAWDLIKNSSAKQATQRKEACEIDTKIKLLLKQI